MNCGSLRGPLLRALRVASAGRATGAATCCTNRRRTSCSPASMTGPPDRQKRIPDGSARLSLSDDLAKHCQRVLRRRMPTSSAAGLMPPESQPPAERSLQSVAVGSCGFFEPVQGIKLLRRESAYLGCATRSWMCGRRRDLSGSRLFYVCPGAPLARGVLQWTR